MTHPPTYAPFTAMEEAMLYTREFRAHGCAAANERRDERVKQFGAWDFGEYLRMLSEFEVRP